MIGNIGNLTAPSGAGGINDMQPRVLAGEQRQRDIASQISQQEKNLAQAEADIKQAEREEEVNVIGAKAQAKQKEADDIRTRQTETKRKMAEFGDPEFHPTEENAVSLAQLFSLVATSGLLLGSSGKMSAMNSLAAMNGAMEGWQAGRADLYKKEVDKFNKETERRRRIREDLRQDLEDYMKLSAMDREAASMKQEEIIRKAGTSSIIGAYAAKGDAQAALNALKSAERIEKDILDRQLKAQEEQRKMLQEERRYQQQVRANQIAERRLQIAEQAAKDKRVGTDAVQFVAEVSGAKLKEKDAAEVLVGAKAIGHAYALKEMVAQHPEWVGRSGQIKQFFNRYIDSLKTGKPLPEDDPNLAKDKSGQEALIFAKDYASYLVEYERALAGGAKGFTVSFQNRFNKLMEQNQFNAEGFDSLMNQHIDEMSRNAIVKSPQKLNKKNITEMGIVINRDDPYAVKGYQRFEGGAAKQPQQQVARPKTDAEFNALPKGQLYIDPEDGKTYRKK